MRPRTMRSTLFPYTTLFRSGKIVLPPKIKRQIGIEMGKDNTRQEFDAWTLQRKRNLLGTNFVFAGGSMRQTLADRKSTRLNSSHVAISYAVFCLKKKKKNTY